MYCETETSIWVDTIKAVVPSLIVTLGWYISHFLTSKRDRKTEIRKRAVDLCGRIIDDTKKIREISLKYHSSSRDKPTELDLVTSFNDLTLALDALKKLGADAEIVDSCSGAILKFKQASTRFHFEDGHTQPLPAGDLILLEISRCASSSIQALDVCRSHILLK